MSARALPSPRLLQPYSPRRPSPLGLPPMGFPPLAPHMAFQSPSYPKTPEWLIAPKGPSETRVHFPPEARRPLAGTTQRPRSQPPPPPLTLNGPHHPPTQPPATAQPKASHMSTIEEDRGPPSPTPSDTSSLSLYSADSVTKNFPIETVSHKQQQQRMEEKSAGLFCGCLNLRALFGGGSKPKNSRILAPPPAQQQPAPAPPMVQVRRRPSPLNI